MLMQGLPGRRPWPQTPCVENPGLPMGPARPGAECVALSQSLCTLSTFFGFMQITSLPQMLDTHRLPQTCAAQGSLHPLFTLCVYSQN